jgi:hypothetical protein
MTISLTLYTIYIKSKMIIWLITLVCDSIRATKEARKAKEAEEVRQIKRNAKRLNVDHPSTSPHLERLSQMTSANSTKMMTNRKDGSWQVKRDETCCTQGDRRSSESFISVIQLVDPCLISETFHC